LRLSYPLIRDGETPLRSPVIVETQELSRQEKRRTPTPCHTCRLISAFQTCSLNCSLNLVDPTLRESVGGRFDSDRQCKQHGDSDRCDAVDTLSKRHTDRNERHCQRDLCQVE